MTRSSGICSVGYAQQVVQSDNNRNACFASDEGLIFCRFDFLQLER